MGKKQNKKQKQTVYCYCNRKIIFSWTVTTVSHDICTLSDSHGILPIKL